MLEQEEWRPVVGFVDLYEVSSLGRVRSLARSWLQRSGSGTVHEHRVNGRMLRPGRMTGGHLSVALGRGRSHCVHKLVLEAFVGPALNGQECRHLDGDESNNRLENLAWGSRSQNNVDKKYHRGCTSTKLWPDDVRKIKRALCRPYRGIVNDLANQFDVSATHICDIRYERVHKDVTI